MPPTALNLRAPLLWLLVPLMAGFTAARLWPLPPGQVWLFVSGAAIMGILALVAAWFDHKKGWMACVGLSVALAGYAYLHVRYPEIHQGEKRPPREITVTLKVWRIFPLSPGARSITGLATITTANRDNTDLIGRRVYFSAIRRISVVPSRSGEYEITGVLDALVPEESAGGFNDYLRNLGINDRLTRARLTREISPPSRAQLFYRAARDRMESILGHGLAAHPEARSLYFAMLLGEKAVLSREQENAFMRSGTFHIFSVSGLHVGVIATALYFLLRIIRLPRRTVVVLTLVMLWLYVQITGAGSPSVRAFLMIAFLLSSEVFRLPGNPLAALTASALLTLTLDPLQLFSTGFQMSYSVVASLIMLGAPLTDRWSSHWKPFALLPQTNWRWWHQLINFSGRKFIMTASGCWAAFLASTPSGIGFFGLFSPGSLVANLVIIPLSSCAIIAGFLSLVFGLIGLHPLSNLLNHLAIALVKLSEWLLLHGTTLPGIFYQAQFRFEALAPISIALLTAVMLAGASTNWARRFGGFWSPWILLVLLIIFGVKFG